MRWPRKNDAEPIRVRQDALGLDGLVTSVDLEPFANAAEAVTGVAVIPVSVVPIGVDLGGQWHPSLPNLVVANLLPLLPPDQTAVRFKFAPMLGGSWQIDDVYVDPRNRF